MRNFFMMVGIPGSGKSTFIRNTFKDSIEANNCVVVSSDSIREEFFGDADLQYTRAFGMRKIRQKRIDISGMSEEELESLFKTLCNGAVYGTMFYRVHKALAEGKDVIYDATNINRGGRVKTLASFKGEYNTSTAYYLDTPLEVAIERNSNRERKVPREVIVSMYERITPPDTDEGFDFVHNITP